MKIPEYTDSQMVRIDNAGALLVKGIENWICALVPMGEQDSYLRMKDADTGAVFLIRREK